MYLPLYILIANLISNCQMQLQVTANHVDSHPFAFLQKTTSDPKLKFRVRLEELREVLEKESLLTKMNDRGLFVVVMTELLGYQFGIFHLRVKALHAEVCRTYKPLKKREDRDNQPPKRNRKTRVNASGVDIQNIANESVSNPSHLQAERRVEVDSRDDSKGSKPSNPQTQPSIDFKAQIQALGPVDFDPMDDVEMQNQMMNHDSSQNTSYSNSTKTSVNAIPNLSEKLKILGGDVSFSVDKRTVLKRRKPNTAGITVKRRDAILDLSTCLDETRQGVDPRELPVPLVREKCRALDFKRMEEEIEDIVGHMALDVKEQILAPVALQRLRDYEFNKGREIKEQPGMDFDYDTGNTLFDQEFMAPTSQNTGNPEESNFSTTLHEELDSKFLRGEKTITLSTLRQRTRKPREAIFMKLLWAAQHGDCFLSQPSPASFGEITVTPVY